METLILIYLFIFGAAFGSFASVLIYRLKSKEKGIIFGRSHCKDCNHNLSALELIPIFSWIKNFGKCKYCKAKVSAIYPILEISTGLAFLGVGKFLINFEKLFLFETFEVLKLFFWLSISFITILYIFYDILFTEIHEGIMGVGIFLAILGLFLNNFGEINRLVFSLNQNFSYENIFFSLGVLLISILGFYIIMLKELEVIYDFLILIFIGVLIYSYKIFFPELSLFDNAILSGLIGALGIFIFFFLQIFFSGGAALGGGDLRIGIMIGLLLGIKFLAIGIFLAYIIGSIIGIFILLKNKKNRKMTAVPFGPFLGLGFFITIFFSKELQIFIINYLGLM